MSRLGVSRAADAYDFNAQQLSKKASVHFAHELERDSTPVVLILAIAYTPSPCVKKQKFGPRV